MCVQTPSCCFVAQRSSHSSVSLSSLNLTICFNVKVLCKAALIFCSFTLRFCTTNMYWVYISNVAYQGQVYAGRLTKIIAMWTVYEWACMCMFLCQFENSCLTLCEAIIWAIFLTSMFSWCFPMCFSVYGQHLSTSVDIFLNTVTFLLRAPRAENFFLHFFIFRKCHIFKFRSISLPPSSFFIYTHAFFSKSCFMSSWFDKLDFRQTLQLLCSMRMRNSVV